MPGLLPTPADVPKGECLTAGLPLAMVLWWLTEAVPFAATALLPVNVAAFVGIRKLASAAGAY